MSAANIAHTACYILLAPLLGGLMSGMDRIISARMQGRQGPPLLQPFYDIIKLFSKETVSVKNIQVCFLVSYLFFVIRVHCFLRALICLWYSSYLLLQISSL